MWYKSIVQVETPGIKETLTTNQVDRFFSRFIFGNDRAHDLYTKYHIPDTLDDRLQIKGGVAILLQGPRDDLSVTVETTHGSRVLNEIAPEGTTFSASDSTLGGRVTTSVDRKVVIVPVGRAMREALSYAIIHGIARVKLHEDLDWHTSSAAAHKLLSAQLSYLQAYGKVQTPTSVDEVRAWEVVGEEERRTSELTLGSLRDLRNLGIEPLPYVRNTRNLTRLVNSSKMLRTARQIEIDPRWTRQQLEVPMTLPEYWVTTFVK